MTTEDRLPQRVREFVAGQLDLPLERLQVTTDVVAAARIAGDDVHEFVEAFGQAFGVDVGSYRWYHHTGPEACNPLWLLVKPWWARQPNVPIRVSDLEEAARRGAWCIPYPEGDQGV